MMTDSNDSDDGGTAVVGSPVPEPSARQQPTVEGSLPGGATFSSVYNVQTGGQGGFGKGQYDPSARTWQPPPTDAPLALLPPTIYGRGELQKELLAALARPDGTLRVLHGIPGGGKSALALWLAREAGNQDREVYWIRNADVAQAMLTVAERRGVDANKVQEARKNWREGQELVWRSLDTASQPWLLVLDNIDDIYEPGVLAASGGGKFDGTGWVRSSRAGLVVVTSRRGDRATWGHSPALHPVKPLGKEMGAKVLGELAPDAGAPEDAKRLAERLGGLPLALRLAGSYLAADPFRYRTFAEYHDAIEHNLNLLDSGEPTPPTIDDEESARRSVMLTWELSLRLLEDKRLEPARPLLQLLSCYGAPHPIRVELAAAEYLAGTPVACGNEPFEQHYLDQVVKNLIAVALVDQVVVASSSVDEQPGDIVCVALHPLVAEVIAASLEGSDNRDPIWTAAQVSLLACAPDDPALWWHWETLPAVHSALLKRMPDHLTGPLSRVIESGSSCAIHLLVSGALQAAHDMIQLALGRAADIPASHPARLRTRLNAASVNQAGGSIASVPDELEALLTEAEQCCAPDDPFLVEIRQRLAATLFEIGRSDEAEELYDALLADHDRDVAPDLVLNTRFGYAQLMAQRGQFEIAEREMTIVLDEEREGLGPEHPATLVTRALLAGIWADRGRLPEARRELEDVLRAQEQRFGPDSATTLDTRVILMGVLSTLRDEGAAQTQLGQLLRIQRDSLNPEHPLALLGLAALIHARASGEGSDSDSRTDERRLRDVCRVMARTYGENHPLVLNTRVIAAIQRHGHDPAGAEEEVKEIRDRQLELHGEGHLAPLNTWLLYAQMMVERDDDKATAEAELRSLHDAQLRSLGRAHPQTVPVLSALANITNLNGDLHASENYLREALTNLERLPGPDHPETQEARGTLVSVLCGLDDYQGAERELLALIGSVERTEGAESLEALATHVMLAMLRAQTDRADQAERDLRAVLEVLFRVHRALADDTEDGIRNGTMVVQWLLANLLRDRGGDALVEAEALLRAALAGLEQLEQGGQDDTGALEVGVDLAELLHERGKLAEAEQHLQLVLGRPRQRQQDPDHEAARNRAARLLPTLGGELEGQRPALAPMPTAPEPVVPDSIASEPVASDSTASEPVAPDSTASEPVAPDSIASEPVAPDSTVPEPVVPALVVPECAVLELVVPGGAVGGPGPPTIPEDRDQRVQDPPAHRSPERDTPGVGSWRAHGRLDEAERDLRAVLERARRTLGDRAPDTLGAQLDLARLLRERGAFEVAERLMAAVFAAGSGMFDSSAWWELRAELAELRRERAAAPRDEAGLRALLAEQEQQCGMDLATARTRHRYALALADQGFPSVAYAELRAVQAAYVRSAAASATLLLRVRVDAAMVRPDRTESDGATAELDTVHRVVDERLGPEHDLTLRVRRGRAQLRLARGAYELAATELQQVLEVRERLSGSPDREKATLRHQLAVAWHGQRELGRAEELHRTVVADLQALAGAGHPQVLLARTALAAVRRDLGVGVARSEFGSLLGAQRQLRGDHHPEVATTRHHLGIALVAAGDVPGARRELGLALHIRIRRLGADHPATWASRAVLDRL